MSALSAATSWLLRLSIRIRWRAAWLLLAGLGPAASAGAEQAPVAAGDWRGGYASRTFTTRSKRLADPSAAAAGLAELVRSPPLGLPPLRLERPPSPEGIDLGRRLFFDRRLSFNGTLSCAMCHIPEQAFTQHELATPVGFQGRAVKRNAPALYNVAYRTTLFFDGRESSLEQQVLSPLLAANEMANPAIGTLLDRLRGLDDYDAAFRSVYGEGVSLRTLGHALADYQRALLSADSPFDRWYFGGEAEAMSGEQKAGFRLFLEVGCAGCHTLADGYAHFTDDGFHDTGVGFRAAMDPNPRLQLAPGVFVELDPEVAAALPGPASDLGRYEATGLAGDRWKFRTPSLRNVALTAPYMHDGSFGNLDEVVAFYDGGGVAHPGLDPRIRPLGLSRSQRRALVAFLGALTGSNVADLAMDARVAPIGDVRHPGEAPQRQ